MLRERFASGELSLDQVDAVSAMATPDTEEALVEESLGLSNAALDRAARRTRGLSEAEERTVWQRRRLGLQWNLDASELRLNGNLPGADLNSTPNSETSHEPRGSRPRHRPEISGRSDSIA